MAGYGDHPADVPGPLRQALLQLVAHWYEQRSGIEVGGPSPHLPTAIAALTAPYRQVRL